MHLLKRVFVSAVLLARGASAVAHAQSVQPVIAEYREHASGSFQVTNTTLVPMAVVLEPRSFSISAQGQGSFRTLDPAIHLELSASSLRLEPRQSATVFYKVEAEKAPAWLCIYAAFTSLHPNPGINVRIMLPHTIYVYQRQPLFREALRISELRYDAEQHQLLLEINNDSRDLGRAESVEVSGPHGAHATAPGFPLLPQDTRRLSIEWTGQQAPERVEIEFPTFTLKLPLEVSALNQVAESRSIEAGK